MNAVMVHSHLHTHRRTSQLFPYAETRLLRHEPSYLADRIWNVKTVNLAHPAQRERSPGNVDAGAGHFVLGRGRPWPSSPRG